MRINQSPDFVRTVAIFGFFYDVRRTLLSECFTHALSLAAKRWNPNLSTDYSVKLCSKSISDINEGYRRLSSIFCHYHCLCSQWKIELLYHQYFYQEFQGSRPNYYLCIYQQVTRYHLLTRSRLSHHLKTPTTSQGL